VIIFADDLGYADTGSYGGWNDSPNLDRMASEGIRFTDFYVPSPVCSASRAALLTGTYNSRVEIHGALRPRSTIGLSLDETTIAEVLKKNGYATALIGKWHLGDHPDASPNNHGFDYYFGLPYSNDMRCKPKNNTLDCRRHPPLPLMQNSEIIEEEPDQRLLTKRYTESAISFIEGNRNSPFFLYLAHTFPHVPLYASKRYFGTSSNGLYGDVVAEIDWSVGKILETLERLRLDEKTLVIFTSDNGPWRVYGNHAGECGPLRGTKGTVWECGIRVPFIARWKNRIPGGLVSKEVAATIDILPTVTAMAGAELPGADIDGKDILNLLYGEEGAKSPHEALYFYYGKNELQAMRWNKWKLHFPHRYRRVLEAGMDGERGKYQYTRTVLELYDLAEDIHERNNVVKLYPDVVARMEEMARIKREELGDSLNNIVGTEQRPAGYFQYPWYERLFWRLQKASARIQHFLFGSHDYPWFKRLYWKIVSLFE
jgi:arylsulfatase A-like enzyme